MAISQRYVEPQNDDPTSIQFSSDSHESTPLLYRAPAQKRTQFLHRLIAVSGIGICFLIFWELLFLGKTSVSRDWDHLHSQKFSMPFLQREILNSVSNASISESLDHYYLSGPHLAGQNLELAEWTRDQLRSYGFEADIKTYEVLLNRPVGHSVTVLNGSSSEKLSLEEDVLPEDELTGSPDRIPTFHGFSASGNATGKLVFAGTGSLRDYKHLEKLGISLQDKIVLVRYGGLFRGLKVREAERRGAAAVLIYTDPIEFGDIRETNGYEAYPNGPAVNMAAVQRGSVADITLSPGDPTTPGWASLPGAKREDPVGLPSIPSIPISARDATILLKTLNGYGPVVDEWVGDLDAAYNLGPSQVDVNVFSDQDYQIRPIYNVIAKLQGVSHEHVLLGNHRDAWVLGAADPNTGSAVLLEIARVLGGLHKQGWKPYRSIILGSWDAEEYGLIGSTEYGEDHASHLKSHAVAYLNTDLGYSGPVFSAGSSPLLHEMIYSSAKIVPAPKGDPNSSLYDFWDAQQGGVHISSLGSGSDYTVFQDHLGIPSLDCGFGGNSTSPVYHYHSNYDSLHWMRTYGDTDMLYHTALARFLAIMVTKLTTHAIIPFRTASYADLFQKQVSQCLDDAGIEPDSPDELVIATRKQVRHFVERASVFDEYLNKLEKDYRKDYAWYHFWRKFVLMAKVQVANLKLMQLERHFLYKHGLDDRNWFKHIVFAPGRNTGYAGQVLPGLVEAIEDKDWDRFFRWLEIVKVKLKAVNSVVGS